MKKLVIFLLAFVAFQVGYGQSAEVAPSYIKAPIVTVLPTYSLLSDIGKIVYLKNLIILSPYDDDLYIWDGISWKSLTRFNQNSITIDGNNNSAIANFNNQNSGENQVTMLVTNEGSGNSGAINAVTFNASPTGETFAVNGYNHSNNSLGRGVKGGSQAGNGVRGESVTGMGVVGIGGTFGVSAYSIAGTALEASIPSSNSTGQVARFIQNSTSNPNSAVQIAHAGPGHSLSILGENSLATNGHLIFSGIGAGVGKVLTSTNTSGNAQWQDNIPKGFVKQLAGSEPIGTNGNGFKTITFNFPSAFATPPKVIATVAAQTGTNFPDTWVATVRSVTTTSVTFNIQRVDNPTAQWTQSPTLNWFAWE